MLPTRYKKQQGKQDYDVAQKIHISMAGEHNPYATLSRRQVALFERNPVCGLCYRVCLDLCEEYGGIRFDLLESIVAADELCEKIVQNPWELSGIEDYRNWVRNRLSFSPPAVACTFATVCVTFSCMDNLPAPVRQLARDFQGLIIGEGNELYDSLRSAAYRQDITLAYDTYGEPPPEPSLVRENEQLRLRTIELENEIKVKNERINKLTNERMKEAPTINNYGTLTYIAEQNNDIHDNQNVYVGNEGLPSERLPKERVNDLGNERMKKLFCNEYGDEDTQRTDEEKQRVQRYIADHNLGNRQLDSARDNPLIRMAVGFCTKWQNLHYLEKPVSATALLRFLSDNCEIELATEPKPIANVLAKMLKAEKDKDTFYDVCDYF